MGEEPAEARRNISPSELESPCASSRLSSATQMLKRSLSSRTSIDLSARSPTCVRAPAEDTEHAREEEPTGSGRDRMG
eukprot:4202019-Pleurochrysis_carterae.AAC.2